MSKFEIPGTTYVPVDDGYELVSRASGIKLIVTDTPELKIFEVRSPEFAGEPEFSDSTEFWDQAARIYAERWIRWVTAEIGLGFHPDTRAEDYEPPLEQPLRTEYDPALGFVFEHLEDPYEVGLDAMYKSGVAVR